MRIVDKLITAKSFSPHAVDSAIDWKVLKIIVVNKRNNVGAVSRQCTPLLRINPQVEHRLNGHTRRRHCKVGFCEDP